MTATVNDQSITITDESLTVSESVGIYECDFTFDASWDTWNKTAVFEGAGETIEMIVVDNKAQIPWEVLKEAGWIKIGVYGTKGGEIKPTIWSDQIYVANGTVPGSVEVTPTPSIYAQILDLANGAKDTADDVANDWAAVTAEASTLAAGSPASASFANNKFMFGIPQGPKGDTGATGAPGTTPAFSIGTVTTLETGQPASASVTGTAAQPVLNLGLPKGNKGDNGDVANTAPAYSTSATYAVGDYCMYNSQLYRCTTAISTAEAWNAAHWTAVKLGEDVSTLRSVLNYATGVIGIPISVKGKYLKIQNGYIDVDNPQTSASGYGYSITPCTAGDVFTASGISSNNEPMAWAFIKSNYEIITKAASLANVSNAKLVAPTGAAYIVIHDKTPYRMSYKGEQLVEQVIEMEADIGDLKNKFAPNVNLFNINDPDIVLNSQLGTNGSISESSGRFVSGYIPARPGMKICCNYPTAIYGSGSFIAYYNSNKEYMSYSTNVEKLTDSRGYQYITYTFNNPTSIGYIRLNGYMESMPYYMYVYADEMPDEYQPYIGNKSFLSDDVIVKFQNVVGDVSGIIGGQWKDKKWYAYGTSITNISSEGKYPNYLAQMSGMTLYNKGISGGGIGNFGAISTGQVYNAICNVTDGKLDADLITLETGANDTGPDVPLGTIYDIGTSTLAGCLNDCLRYLQANTNAQIAVTISPATTTQPGAASKYTEWAEMIERICHLNRVHFLNGDNNMGYGKISDAGKGSLYVVDSIHQTNLGGFIMAQNLWYQLRNVPLFYTAIPT